MFTALLLSAGAQAQQAEALIEAIQADDVAQVRTLLAAGADASARLDRYGATLTPLGAALGRQGAVMLELVDLLLEAGADPNGVYGDPHDLTVPLLTAFRAETYLQWESLEGQANLMRRLLDAGADPEVVYCGAFGPGSLAYEAMLMGNSRVLVMLAEAGADDIVAAEELPAYEDLPVHEVSATEPLTEPLGERADAEEYDPWADADVVYDRAYPDHAGPAEEDPGLGVLPPHDVALRRHDAPLHAALFAGDVEAVERLLASGYAPRQILEGRTLLNGEVERFGPLGIALYFVHNVWPPVDAEAMVSMARLLLAAGADPDEVIEPVCEGVRVPALVAAIGAGDSGLVRAVLEAGANPELPMQSREATLPSLVFAAEGGHIEIVRLLLEAGADPNDAGRVGSETVTAWRTAAERGNQEVVELLRAAGAEEPAPGARPSGRSPFTDAFAACEVGAAMSDGSAGLAAVRYEVLGPESGRCRVSMAYTSNPNPDWVDRPLTMLLDPAEDFLGQVMEAMHACLAGDADSFACEGPC